MRVRAKTVDPSQLSEKEALYFTAPPHDHLTPGKEYSVYAVSMYDGVTFVLHVDDLDTPTFTAAFAFDVVDAQIGRDWICTLHAGDGVRLVLGPEYLAKDQTSYSAMVDQTRAAVTEFWRRIDHGVEPPPFPAKA